MNIKYERNEKLDLKSVFQMMDSSGDGFINIDEMVTAFQSLGVKLTAEAADALYRSEYHSHFFITFVWSNLFTIYI